MKLSRKVKDILKNYESDNPGTKANLAKILSHGKLGGSGRLVILPVDQGFEHGPACSFAEQIPLILKVNSSNALSHISQDKN